MKYSEDNGITAQAASLLFIYIGLASSVARIITGKLCNNKKVNPVFIHQACMLLASLSAFLLPYATKYRYLIGFSVVYGISDGVFAASQNIIVLSCVDSKRITASFCTNNFLYAFTAAAGGPIAGELVCCTSFQRRSDLYFTKRTSGSAPTGGWCSITY